MKQLFTTTILILFMQVAAFAQTARILETIIGTGSNEYKFDEDALKMSLGTLGKKVTMVDQLGAFYFYYTNDLYQDSLCKVEHGKVRRIINNDLLDNNILQIDSKGYIYGFSIKHSRIGRIDTLTGTLEWLSAPLGLTIIGGFIVDTNGVMYYAHTNSLDSNYIYKMLPDGTRTIIAGTGKAGYTGDGGLAINAEIRGGTGITLNLDNSGNLLFVNLNNDYTLSDISKGRFTLPLAIRKVDKLTGIITTVVGGVPIGHSPDGVPAKGASINSQRFLTFDFSLDYFNNIYFTEEVKFTSDSISILIRKVDNKTGLLSTEAGSREGTMLKNGIKNPDGNPAIGTVIAAFPRLSVDPTGTYICYKERNNWYRSVTPPPISITEHTLQTFTLYPNPATTTLHINGISKQIPYRIVDIQGRVLQQAELNSSSIDITTLTQGMYVLQIEGYKPVMFEKR
jgi:hypothetical protein